MIKGIDLRHHWLGIIILSALLMVISTRDSLAFYSPHSMMGNPMMGRMGMMGNPMMGGMGMMNPMMGGMSMMNPMMGGMGMMSANLPDDATPEEKVNHYLTESYMLIQRALQFKMTRLMQDLQSLSMTAAGKQLPWSTAKENIQYLIYNTQFSLKKLSMYYMIVKNANTQGFTNSTTEMEFKDAEILSLSRVAYFVYIFLNDCDHNLALEEIAANLNYAATMVDVDKKIITAFNGVRAGISEAAASAAPYSSSTMISPMTSSTGMMPSVTTGYGTAPMTPAMTPPTYTTPTTAYSSATSYNAPRNPSMTARGYSPATPAQSPAAYAPPSSISGYSSPVTSYGSPQTPQAASYGRATAPATGPSHLLSISRRPGT